MVGSVLCKRLQTLDIPHLKLSRHPSHSSEDQVFWDPHERILETEKLREVETVIHLAGEPVGKRWTHEIKKKIIFSRSDAGRFLFETLAAQDKPPKTLISASGIGFYGVANETKFNEESAKGRGFLADVVEEWESAPEPLHKVGTRVVNMRM